MISAQQISISKRIGDFQMQAISNNILLLLASTFLATFPSAFPAIADEVVSNGRDWTIQLETEQLTEKFSYKGSTLYPVDKIEVSCIKADSSSTQKYEKLWYHDGKAVGIERDHAFGGTNGGIGIPLGDGICVNVVSKNGHSAHESESKAAANAIMRIWVDSYMNQSPLVNVQVPAQSFHSIAGYLLTQKCIEVSPDNIEKPRNESMTMLLISNPEGLKMKLAYTP
jgi:hypothetical protein